MRCANKHPHKVCSSTKRGASNNPRRAHSGMNLFVKRISSPGTVERHLIFKSNVLVVDVHIVRTVEQDHGYWGHDWILPMAFVDYLTRKKHPVLK